VDHCRFQIHCVPHSHSSISNCTCNPSRLSCKRVGKLFSCYPGNADNSPPIHLAQHGDLAVGIALDLGRSFSFCQPQHPMVRRATQVQPSACCIRVSTIIGTVVFVALIQRRVARVAVDARGGLAERCKQQDFVG